MSLRGGELLFFYPVGILRKLRRIRRVEGSSSMYGRGLTRVFPRPFVSDAPSPPPLPSMHANGDGAIIGGGEGRPFLEAGSEDATATEAVTGNRGGKGEARKACFAPFFSPGEEGELRHARLRNFVAGNSPISPSVTFSSPLLVAVHVAVLELFDRA